MGLPLGMALEAYGLRFSTPSLSYFTDTSINRGAWLNIRPIGEDTLREAEIKKRINECAKAIEDIYTSKKKEKPLVTEIDIFNEPNGKTAIAAFLKDLPGEDISIAMLFDKSLQEALAKNGFQLSRPSYEYFISPQIQHRGWLNVRPL